MAVPRRHFTGAKPTPRHVLAAAMPHRVVGVTPPFFIRIPQKLSYWLNNLHGDCVAAEEAFAKACSGIYISDNAVLMWAKKNGVLNGAYMAEVLDAMVVSGFQQDGNTYDNGGKVSVDYTDWTMTTNAVYQGPVKIGVASEQLDDIVGTDNGWFGTGFQPDGNLDHCISICGYGTMAWLAQQFGVTVPSGVDGTQSGYAVFTWDTIGIMDVPSMVNITGEAWLRTPTTITVGNNPPTPDQVVTPVPPPSLVPKFEESAIETPQPMVFQERGDPRQDFLDGLVVALWRNFKSL